MYLYIDVPHYFNFNFNLSKQTDEVQWNLFVHLTKHANYHNICDYVMLSSS